MAAGLWSMAAAMAMAGGAALADPPARVGRISHVNGEASFQASANHEPAPAQLNWPVTNANVLMTGPSGRAEVTVGSTAVRIDGDSEIEFVRLDDEQIAVRVLAGRMSLRVRHRDQADDLLITTPHGRALIDDVGRYRIDVRADQSLTAFTVHEGAARFDLPDTSLVAQSGTRIEAWGGQGASGHQSARAYRDNFDEWGWARDRRAEATRAVNYVSPDMTGYDDLDEHGQWRHVEEYGTVWVPHAHAVPADWAPYRWGRWAWVDPWGWTWVDQAPWGFAPFHYGRWVHHRGAWAWAPGVIVRRPVYAPALVGWVGRPGASVSIATGPAVGWFPLAPREVYYPAHPCTPHYVRNVNVTHVANPGTIVHPAHGRHDPAHRMHYRNADLPHAVTLVPAHTMSRGGLVTPNHAVRADSRTLAALPVAAAPSTLAPSRPQFAGPEHRPGQFWSPHRSGDRRDERRSAVTGVAPQAPTANAPQTVVTPRPERRDMHEPGGRDRRIDAPTPRGFPPVPAGPLNGQGAPAGAPAVPNPSQPNLQITKPAQVPGTQAPVVRQPQQPPVQQPSVQQPPTPVPGANPPVVRGHRRDGSERPQIYDRQPGNERRDWSERPRPETPRVEAPRMERPRIEQPRIEPPRQESPRFERPREMPRVEQRVEQRVERRMDHQPPQAPAPMQVERRAPPAPMQPERRAAPAPAPMPAVSTAPVPRAEPARQHGGGNSGQQGQPQRRGPPDQKR